MSHDYTSIEDLLFATLDAVSRSAWGNARPLAPRSTPGPCSPKLRAVCTMGNGETGLEGSALQSARRPCDEVGRHGSNSRGSN